MLARLTPVTPEPETAQTLDRGLHVLELLAGAAGHGGMTISSLAGELGVGRSVAYRLVATLVARHYAVRGPDGRVRLGLASSRLAVAVRPALVEAARPLLRALADELGATAHLTVVEPGAIDAIALVVMEPTWTDFHVAYRVGSRHPLSQGAAGRAVLSGRRGLPGAVATQGELQVGAHGVAAPVLGVTGLEASVGVVSMTPISDGEAAARVERAAQQVARALGAERS